MHCYFYFFSIHTLKPKPLYIPAACAVRICNAWSAAVNQVPSGTDIPGLSGIPVFDFALAAEVLRIYPGWAASDFTRFKNMMTTYFYPVCHNFLTNHNGSCLTNYWANWDACNLGALIAMGVLCDDTAKYNEGVNYFRTGAGNGSITNAVYTLHPGGIGQWQESGRDQEHAQLGNVFRITGSSMTWTGGNDYTWLPAWFRLQRSGNTFTAYESSDGVTWFTVGTSTVTMANTYYIGLATCSGSTTGALDNTTFDNVTVVAGAPQLIPNGTYKLLARHSNKALDVTNNGTANGTNVQQWTANDCPCQQWTLTYLGSGQYQVIGAPNVQCNDHRYGRSGLRRDDCFP